MFSHIMIGTDDIERSKNFYNAVIKVLGGREPLVNPNATGQTRLFYIHKGSVFCITEPINGENTTVSNGFTLGFACDSPEQVQELHEVALANGATPIEEPPGLRESPAGSAHLCYFRDPDGHKICGMYRM